MLEILQFIARDFWTWAACTFFSVAVIWITGGAIAKIVSAIRGETYCDVCGD